jgi:hypothetical protein
VGVKLVSSGVKQCQEGPKGSRWVMLDQVESSGVLSTVHCLPSNVYCELVTVQSPLSTVQCPLFPIRFYPVCIRFKGLTSLNTSVFGWSFDFEFKTRNLTFLIGQGGGG